MSSDLEKYRSLYFTEAQAQLAAIHNSLDALADAPTDRNELNAAFRAAHTLKAMSATMGYGELTRASHSLEDLLARMKNQNETPTDLTIRLLRNAAEEINVRLRRAETTAVIAAVENRLKSHPLPIFTSPLAANVRVRQQDLNLLLELVAELAASSNVLEYAASQSHAPQADTAVRNQRELVPRMRRLTWQLNMSPIGPVFDRYGRVLAELARQQNKTLPRRHAGRGCGIVSHDARRVERAASCISCATRLRTASKCPPNGHGRKKTRRASSRCSAQRKGDRVLIQVER